MSSAINHAKRSHRSAARHYRAAGLRKITTMCQQERRGLNPFLRPGFFKPRRTSAGNSSTGKAAVK